MTVIILTQQPAQSRVLAGIVPPGESVTRGAPSSVSRNRLAAGPIRMHFKRFQSRTFELFRMGGEYHCVTNDGGSHWWLFCFLYISNLHVSHQCSFRLSWILNVDTTQITTSTYKLQMIISLIFMEQFFSCHSLKPGVTQIWGKKIKKQLSYIGLDILNNYWIWMMNNWMNIWSG